MTKDEALRLALWALDSVLANHKGAPVLPWIEARDAVKAALEAKDEPWEQFYPEMGKPQFTPPQRTWVGLTDSEIGTIAYNVNPLDGIRQFSRAIEAKLKEKNT